MLSPAWAAGSRKPQQGASWSPVPQPAGEKPGKAGVTLGNHGERGAAASKPFPTCSTQGSLGPRAMADSSGPGSSGPWWKSLTGSKKKSKEAPLGAQPQAQPGHGDPSPPPEQDWTSSSRENQHPNVLGGAGETPKSDKLCAEKSGNSRRNLKISRSGRFKEKRKVRATLLPEGDRSPEEADFPGDPQDDKQ